MMPVAARARLFPRTIGVLLGTWLLASSPAARAGDPIAESMFQEALVMMREGRFEDARRLLEASHKLEPRSGTLLSIAACNEELGRTATAWAQYKDAASLARAEGRNEHVEKATARAASVESRLSKLRVDAQTMQGGVQVTVELDGKLVLDGALGIDFAIDPGDHVISARAPGREPWSTTIRIGPSGDTQVVRLPELAPLVPPSSKPPGPTAPVAPPIAPATFADADTSLPVWPWVVGGLGLTSVGVGIGFAVDQQLAASELEDRCGADRSRCPADYDFEPVRSREERSHALGLGFSVSGGLALGAAVIGLLVSTTETSNETARARVDVGPHGARVRVDF
jgi:serine/threonine-protein kinase